MLQHASRFLIALLLVHVIPIASLPASANTAEKEPRERIVMGWLESVVIEPWGVKLRAKLDTGAKTSSMHALDIQRIKRNGDVWVRFTLEHREKKTNKAKTFTMERPVLRDARVKRDEGSPVPRPVVAVDFCLNGMTHSAEFTLTDRGNYFYLVLLGRRFLKDVALVDPDATFLTSSSRCADEAKSTSVKD